MHVGSLSTQKEYVRNVQMQRFCLPVLLVLLVLLVACSRSSDRGEPNGTETGDNADLAAGRDAGGDGETAPGPIPTADTPQPRPTPPRPAAPQARLLPVTRNDELLSLDSVFVEYPSDFVIGPLYRPGRDGDSQSIVRLTDRFIAELNDGKLSPETVHPDSIQHLVRSLRRYFDEEISITAARLGQPIVGGEGLAEVTVRLFGKPGQAEALVVFELDGRRWYVVDLQVNLQLLESPPRVDDTLFEPPLTLGRG